MKKILFVLLLAIVLGSCVQNEAKMNSLTKAEKEQGWKLLFNGENMDGWRFFKGGDITTGWKVIDGVLNNSGVGSDHGGDIVTVDQFKDFELYIEWKIAPESNSGIFFHVQEDSVDAVYASGPEYQLLDDKGWPRELEANRYTGACYNMYTPENAEVKPIDEWNSTRIVAKGPHVEHYLNGVKVVEYDMWTDDWNNRIQESKWNEYPYYGQSKTGHIGLQDHGGLTQFRNIKIREI